MSWETSDEIQKLSVAMVAALGEMSDITKSKEATVPTKAGGSYKYRYADLADTLSSARPILAKHGLAVLQTVTTSKDSVLIWTTILHAQGEWIRFEPLALPAGRTAQETGSAITYGRRYALLACLGLAAEDDDGASAAPRGATTTKQTQVVERDTSRPPEPRTKEEEQIRQLLAEIPAASARRIRADFRSRFGALLDLDVERHAEALDWVERAVDEAEMSPLDQIVEEGQ